MSTYINGTGVISAQKTFDGEVFKSGFITFDSNRITCYEPEYSQFIDGKQIRRMSRIIRMGIVASMLATRNANIQKPDAIVVGTAFGCLEDTYSFLSKLVQHSEDMLSPTAFIHSTHNTIAAQIALLFQCRGYNSTYVHKALSFESALMDAVMLIDEKSADNVLVGGIDEIINASFHIMDRMGFYKDATASGADNFYNTSSKGTTAGEGAAFFSISGTKNATSAAEVSEVEIMSFVNKDEVLERANQILKKHNISKPDLLITGHNGDRLNDETNDYIVSKLQCSEQTLKYKHWCGEYGTATGFATWLAAEILKGKKIPSWAPQPLVPGTEVNNVLIYNQQEELHHSLIMLRSC